ncbi:hypothetical protein DFS34DRAFT_640627, partial [Phlyctochytrium arcticum]
ISARLFRNAFARLPARYTTPLVRRGFASATGEGAYTAWTLIPGDGIGPEISKSVVSIFEAQGVPVVWESVDVYPILRDGKTTIPDDSLVSINKNKVALKGPLATPVGKGHVSMNLTLRRYSIVGYKTPFDDVDTVLIRENTEGEYSGIEHVVIDGVVQSIKLITEEASRRCATYAFEYARAIGRDRVTIVHKANIQKLADGLFLSVAQEVGKDYPDIKMDDVLLDRTPTKFSSTVMAMPNLYGDILSDLIFASVPRYCPRYRWKGLGQSNGLVVVRRHDVATMKMDAHADSIQQAVLKTIAENHARTGDLGGKATNTQFTQAVISNLTK